MSDQPGLPDSFPIRLTHLDDAGAARMVDVTAKAPGWIRSGPGGWTSPVRRRLRRSGGR